MATGARQKTSSVIGTTKAKAKETAATNAASSAGNTTAAQTAKRKQQVADAKAAPKPTGTRKTRKAAIRTRKKESPRTRTGQPKTAGKGGIQATKGDRRGQKNLGLTSDQMRARRIRKGILGADGTKTGKKGKFSDKNKTY